MNKLNLKEIGVEISKYFSSVKEVQISLETSVKTGTERLEETYKKIAELEKTRDELIKKIEVKNANK